MINHEKVQAVQSLFDGIAKEHSPEMAHAVLMASKSISVGGMIHRADFVNEVQKAQILDALSNTLAAMMATITSAFDLDPEEVTRLADRVRDTATATQQTFH